jgi:small subunit ribosomal protein S6
LLATIGDCRQSYQKRGVFVLREYEFTIITRADLQDADRSKVLERYEDLMYKNTGELIKREDWGVKKLAFPMKKKHRGHYTFYDFAGGTAENLKEAERLLRIDENVLRYMLIRTHEKVDVSKRREELAKNVQQRQAEH